MDLQKGLGSDPKSFFVAAFSPIPATHDQQKMEKSEFLAREG